MDFGGGPWVGVVGGLQWWTLGFWWSTLVFDFGVGLWCWSLVVDFGGLGCGGDFAGVFWWWALDPILQWTMVVDFGGGPWVGIVGGL